MNSPLLTGQEIEAGNRFWNSYGNGELVARLYPFPMSFTWVIKNGLKCKKRDTHLKNDPINLGRKLSTSGMFMKA